MEGSDGPGLACQQADERLTNGFPEELLSLRIYLWSPTRSCPDLTYAFVTTQALLKSPLLLDCKDNPEHGLRFVLTFQQATSFLVPMDRCVLLAQQVIFFRRPKFRRERKSRSKQTGGHG